ncbi:MAG TPA: septum formation initiator [Thermaerobacter sp.]
MEPGWGPAEAQRPVRRYKIRRRLRLRPEARLVATVGVLFLLAVVVISRYALLYELNRAILQRQQEVAQLQRATEHMAIEVASLDSLDRLEQAARQRGYEEPQSVRAVRVPAAGPATAANGTPATAPGAVAPAQAGQEPVREAVVNLPPATPERPGTGGWVAALWHRWFGS